MRNLKSAFSELVIERQQLLMNKKKHKKTVDELQTKMDLHIKARAVLNYILQNSQTELKEYVEKLVTIAIRFVFEERPFTFELRFEEKGNQTICTPIIKEGTYELDRKEDIGGSLIDPSNITLRVVLWYIETPKSMNTFLLDEPFPWSGALIGKVGEALQYLSKELNFQVIVISHNNEIINICDKVWQVNHRNKRSKVKLIKGREIKRRRKWKPLR